MKKKMMGFDLNKKSKIKSYFFACVYGVLFAVNIFKPTWISLVLAVVVFWFNIFWDNFFVDILSKNSVEEKKLLGKKGIDWILAYLMMWIPLIIYYFHATPTRKIINNTKFTIAMIAFLLIAILLYVAYISKFHFIKKKMYKACIVTGILIVVYFGFVFCEMNYFLDSEKETIVVDVDGITGHGFHTNFIYIDSSGKKQVVTTYDRVREDYTKILIQEDEGALGLMYKNVYVAGVE